MHASEGLAFNRVAILNPGKVPDREISIAQRPPVGDNFPNGKLSKP